MAHLVENQILRWAPPSSDVSGVGGILALAFGYREDQNGYVTPGPVNHQLANLTVNLWRQARCPVYAQWEIAKAIGPRIPSNHVKPIYPAVDTASGVKKYLSTYGVIAQVKKLVKRPASLGKVLIVAHRDHALRCVRTARRLGFKNSFTPPVGQLPVNYDPKSAQPWTRNRLAYILHDILSRLEAYRSEVIGSSSPSRQLG
ncbi:MAG: hypothetical protein HY735_37475 [Verrucomicrobia bacterium]|nr:hypothetical protein [Verrucomicrobiota bacterium]